MSSEMNNDAGEIATARLACSKCGAPLPDWAQFCVQCGKPTSVPASGSAAEIPLENLNVIAPATEPPVRRRKRHPVLWTLLGLFLVAMVWAAVSDNFVAQGIQGLLGWKHDQTILQTPFTVGPHSFRYYKFALPEGSMNVSMVGEFKSAGAAGGDNNVDVLVLTEPAFIVWQKGYTTSSVYESGPKAEGSLQAPLPPGAGIYYLVFSNKLAAKSSKEIHATVLLRYKSWMPTWLRSAKEPFVN